MTEHAAPSLCHLHARGLHSLTVAAERLATRPVTLADVALGLPEVISGAFGWESLKTARAEIRAAIKKHGADAVMTTNDALRPGETFTPAELLTRLDDIEAQLAPYRRLMEGRP